MSAEFSTPSWLIAYLHGIGCLSLSLNIAVIYLIIWKSEKLDNFRYFLLLFQMLCTQTDTFFNFLTQPFPLSPLLAGYCNGYLASYWMVSSVYLVPLLTASFVALIECLIFCFIKRHQSIAKLAYRHVISNGTYVFGTILSFSLPVIIGILFTLAGIGKDDQMDYVKEHYPEYYLEFLSLKNFVIYSLNAYFIILLVLTFFGGLLCAIVFSSITLDMLKMLKEIQRKVSMVNFRRYQVAVHSLLAQFCTSSLLSVPLLLFLVLATSQIGNSHSAAIILVVVIPFYSPANAVVLVMTTPPYRKFVLRHVLQRSTRPINQFSFLGANRKERLSQVCSPPRIRCHG